MTTTNRVQGYLNEIKVLANLLPEGKGNMVKNRCDKISVALKKDIKRNVSLAYQTDEQIENRDISLRMIYEAMKNGRHLTMMDAREFRCSQMHTQLCHLRTWMDRHNLPWTMKSKWITYAENKRCKEYWLESNN